MEVKASNCPPGPPGPPNSLTIGEVSIGPVGATITGEAPNQVLNLVVPSCESLNPAIFLIHPTSRSVFAGSSVTFYAAAAGSEAVSYEWQYSDDDGETWVDISQTRQEVDAQNRQVSYLDLNNVSTQLTGRNFRCSAGMQSSGRSYSNMATLTVSALPSNTQIWQWSLFNSSEDNRSSLFANIDPVEDNAVGGRLWLANGKFFTREYSSDDGVNWTKMVTPRSEYYVKWGEWGSFVQGGVTIRPLGSGFIAAFESSTSPYSMEWGSMSASGSTSPPQAAPRELVSLSHDGINWSIINTVTFDKNLWDCCSQSSRLTTTKPNPWDISGQAYRDDNTSAFDGPSASLKWTNGPMNISYNAEETAAFLSNMSPGDPNAPQSSSQWIFPLVVTSDGVRFPTGRLNPSPTVWITLACDTHEEFDYLTKFGGSLNIEGSNWVTSAQSLIAGYLFSGKIYGGNTGVVPSISSDPVPVAMGETSWIVVTNPEARAGSGGTTNNDAPGHSSISRPIGIDMHMPAYANGLWIGTDKTLNKYYISTDLISWTERSIELPGGQLPDGYFLGRGYSKNGKFIAPVFQFTQQGQEAAPNFQGIVYTQP